MYKKFITALLSLVLLVTLIPVHAAAPSEASADQADGIIISYFIPEWFRQLGDVTGTGVIDNMDLVLIAQNFGPVNFDCPISRRSDLTGSGIVGMEDFMIAQANLGRTFYVRPIPVYPSIVVHTHNVPWQGEHWNACWSAMTFNWDFGGRYYYAFTNTWDWIHLTGFPTGHPGFTVIIVYLRADGTYQLLGEASGNTLGSTLSFINIQRWDYDFWDIFINWRSEW